MSGETIAVPVLRNDASDYMLRASYSASVHKGVDQDVIEYYEHQFSSQGLFPDLHEYSKTSSVENGAFSSLSFEKEGMASLKIVGTSGGFKNVLGHYQVNSDGTIQNVQIAFSNTRSKKMEITHQFNIDAGSNVHLFVVANGFALNREFSNESIDSGEFSFLYKFGESEERLAKITDSADDITLIYTSSTGDTEEIRGPIYHTTNDDAQQSINSDGHKHAVSGRISEDTDSVLRIGFEDFPGLGDADYNDIVVDLSVVHPQLVDEGSGNDFVQALHGQSIETQDLRDDSPLYDQEDNGTNFFWGLVNGIDLGLDVALNDEREEEGTINIDDILTPESDHNDDLIAFYLDVTKHESVHEGINQEADTAQSMDAVINLAETNDFPDLEALLNLV